MAAIQGSRSGCCHHTSFSTTRNYRMALQYCCRKPAHFHRLPARKAAKMGAHCCLPTTTPRVDIQWKLICTWNPIASELEIWLSALRGLQRRRGDWLSTTLQTPLLFSCHCSHLSFCPRQLLQRRLFSSQAPKGMPAWE